jgi:predicted RecA/RadA family phage recombinase
MAQNYIQKGNSLDLVAPYDVNSGDGMLVGSLFGVASNDAVSGAAVVAELVGVWELKKTSAQAWTQGAKVYWDNTAKEVTTTATANTLIGVAAEAAANPSSTGIVRLNGAVA